MINRIERMAKELPAGVDCAIVTSEYGRYYLTGIRTGDAGTLLVTREKSYFIIDFRYIETARAEVKDCEVVLEDKTYDQINEILARHNVKTAAVETTYITMGRFLRMKEQLSGVQLLTSSEVDSQIIDYRSHKDAGELKSIRRAQDIADKGFTHILNYIKPGRTELEIAIELQHYMQCQGAEKLSFDTICVSGAKTSLPHGTPGDKKVEKGDFVTLDFGAMVDGYCSDMTRTIAVGSVTQEMKDVYYTVLRAHDEALAAVEVGKPNVDIDRVARDIINKAGYEGCFGHGLGHSVGMEIHEEPRYSPRGKGECEVGHVMTIEPGIYLEGRFGVRIEDMIYIGENGVLNLASSPRELIIL